MANEAQNPNLQSEVDAVMKKYDRESNTRVWEGVPKRLVQAVLVFFSLFAIYVTLFATWLDQIRLTSFVGLILVMGYLVYPAKKGTQKVNRIPWYDVLLLAMGAGAFFYYCINASQIIMRLPTITTLEIIIGICGLIALIELCRRCVGIPILCVAGFFIIYALYFYGISGNLGLAGSVRTLVYRLFYTTTGVLSTPINVCSKFIVVFIIFGAFLERTGISDFFISMANSLAGSSSGGPAKVAVISSALCGMVSGSSVGNTVTTGSVTIPMMKKTGYKGEFAAAVEASASTGGQIMPPIMGAAAFLMADYVGIPYSNIIVRAILPAFLYFAGIFICVHLEARKLGLVGISRDQLPKIKQLIKKSFLLLPLVILIYLVASNTKTMAYSAAIAILFAIGVSNMYKDPVLSIVGCAALLVYLFVPLPIAVSTCLLVVGILSCFICMLKKGAEMNVPKFFDALAAGGKSCITVAVACAVAGIIAGCITMTGLASTIIAGIINIAGGSKFIALFLTMLCCIVLGMGVPTTANYCIMASTCAPILIQMGIPALAAHFFVFYFGIVADITPPVALAAYAGSAIAKSNPMKTALNATKLAIAAFIVPYCFALNPVMLFIDANPAEVISICVSALIGIFGVAAALQGYVFAKIHWAVRIVLAAAGLALIYPGIFTDLCGAAMVAAIMLLQLQRRRKETGVSFSRKTAVLALVAVVLAATAILSPAFIKSCHSCGKTFVGSGYYSQAEAASRNVSVSDTVICDDCCEIEYANELAGGTYTKGYLSRPLF